MLIFGLLGAAKQLSKQLGSALVTLFRLQNLVGVALQVGGLR